MLFKKCGSNTLLSREPVEPIIPLRLLVDQGYVIDGSSNSCRIKHPERGEVQCWRRQGCPVLSEEEGLKLLKELEAGYRFVGGVRDTQRCEDSSRRTALESTPTKEN